MKSILDPSFKYVPAASSDIRKTFQRVRREAAKARDPGVVYDSFCTFCMARVGDRHAKGCHSFRPQRVVALTPKDRKKA